MKVSKCCGAAVRVRGGVEGTRWHMCVECKLATDPVPAPPKPKPIKWHPITQTPKVEHGWFAAAINPVNADECSAESLNEWRRKYGFTKVWYNKDSSHGGWWGGDKPIKNRMTHWAELPSVPLL